MLSNGGLGSVETGGASLVYNCTESGANAGCASVGEFSTLVVAESFGNSVCTGEDVDLMWNLGFINVVTGG